MSIDGVLDDVGGGVAVVVARIVIDHGDIDASASLVGDVHDHAALDDNHDLMFAAVGLEAATGTIVSSRNGQSPGLADAFEELRDFGSGAARGRSAARRSAPRALRRSRRTR